MENRKTKGKHYNDLTDRVIQFMQKFTLSQNNFSERIGFTQGNISAMLSGQQGVSIGVVMGILNEWREISAEWLLRGEGQMMRVIPDTPTPDQVQDADTKYQNPNQKLISWLSEEIVILRSELRHVVKEVDKLKNQNA